MKPRLIEIFCDGAYSQLHKIGAYGVVLKNGKVVEFSDAEANTTIARMELMGAVIALESLKKTSQVTVVSDSKYVIDGANKNIKKWISNGWTTSQSLNVSNKDLWLRLLACCAKHCISWEWVKGHNGHEFNERADALAKAAIDEYVRG